MQSEFAECGSVKYSILLIQYLVFLYLNTSDHDALRHLTVLFILSSHNFDGILMESIALKFECRLFPPRSDLRRRRAGLSTECAHDEADDFKFATFSN